MINDWTEIGMTEDWIKIQMSQVVYSNNVQMAIDWCVTNICRTGGVRPDRWYYRGLGEFRFEHDRDAVLFALRWS
jgi:hypothetical protein